MSRRLHLISRSKKRLTLFGVIVVALAVAAGAVAYWTTSGSGSASATAGTTEAVTISPAAPTSALYPGGSADVAARISNPNSIAVHLPSLMLDTSRGTNGFDVDGAHAGCDVSALSFTTQTNGGGDFVVPPKVGSTDGALDVDLADAIAMGTSAADACQGATFTVYLKVGP